MRNTFINQLQFRAKEDPSILLLTGDLGYGVVDNFALELPEQFINFGINEQTMMSAAAGLASKGFKPFVYSIGNFPTFRCLEQIRNDVCHMNLDVCIVALGAGFSYGTAGYSHHLIEDISALSVLPNMSIFSPADTLETEALLPKILAKRGPKYLRLGKGGEGELTQDFQQVAPGISARTGSINFAIVVSGNILSQVIPAVDSFKSESRPTIVSVSELDSIREFIPKVNFEGILTVEEHLLRGGFGTMILELAPQASCRVTRLGIAQLSGEVAGSQQYLRTCYRLNTDSIIEAIETLIAH
jgi:transketolase